jgi:hypothetical protein
VTYHEGLGHALAMPHPQARQATCVMDLGQYQDLPLMELHICPEIKADMVTPSLAPVIKALAGGSSNQQAPATTAATAGAAYFTTVPFAVLSAAPDDNPRTTSMHVARRLLAAQAAAARLLLIPTLQTTASAPRILHLGWAVTEDNPGAASLFFRVQPVLSVLTAPLPAPAAHLRGGIVAASPAIALPDAAGHLPEAAELRAIVQSLGDATLPPPLFTPAPRFACALTAEGNVSSKKFCCASIRLGNARHLFRAPQGCCFAVDAAILTWFRKCCCLGRPFQCRQQCRCSNSSQVARALTVRRVRPRRDLDRDRGELNAWVQYGCVT